MFGNIVMEIEGSEFEKIITKAKKDKGVKNDVDLDVHDLKNLCDEYKHLIKHKKNNALHPRNPLHLLTKPPHRVNLTKPC